MTRKSYGLSSFVSRIKQIDNNIFKLPAQIGILKIKRGHAARPSDGRFVAESNSHIG